MIRVAYEPLITIREQHGAERRQVVREEPVICNVCGCREPGPYHVNLNHSGIRLCEAHARFVANALLGNRIANQLG
jgi:hypothetical protein